MKRLEWILATQKMARTGKIIKMEEILCNHFLLQLVYFTRFNVDLLKWHLVHVLFL